MTKAEASKVVAVLSAAYPNVRIGEETAEVYETTLADLDYALTQRAALELIRTAKFFPSVAEIREAVALQRAKVPERPLRLVPASERVPYAEVVQLIGTIGRRP